MSRLSSKPLLTARLIYSICICIYMNCQIEMNKLSRAQSFLGCTCFPHLHRSGSGSRSRSGSWSWSSEWPPRPVVVLHHIIKWPEKNIIKRRSERGHSAQKYQTALLKIRTFFLRLVPEHPLIQIVPFSVFG